MSKNAKDTKFELAWAVNPELSGQGGPEKWPTLTWTWAGGSFTVTDYVMVKTDDTTFVAETLWNPLSGPHPELDEASKGDMDAVLLLDARDWTHNDAGYDLTVPNGTVLAAVVDRSGWVYAKRAFYDAEISIADSDGMPVISITVPLDGVAEAHRVLAGYGIKFSMTDPVASTRRCTNMHPKPLCHVSDLAIVQGLVPA